MRPLIEKWERTRRRDPWDREAVDELIAYIRELEAAIVAWSKKGSSVCEFCEACEALRAIAKSIPGEEGEQCSKD